MSLQEAAHKELGGVEGAELVQYSRYYRSALHECVIALKKKAEGETEDGELHCILHIHPGSLRNTLIS